jgi:RecJ-like exonuclease
MTDNSAGEDAGTTEGGSPSERRDVPDDATLVYDLDDDCTIDDVAEGKRYLVTVNGVVDYGVFVDVSDTVSGLVHESSLQGDYEKGDELVVRLTEIRENGDIAFEEVDPAENAVVPVEHEPEITPVGDLRRGESVTVEGELTQIKQTGGPTIFHVGDGTGIVAAAAFEEAGVRAYPEAEIGDVVQVSGEVGRHEGVRQLEVDDVTVLEDEDAEATRERLDEARTERASPESVEPLVEWDAFEKLRPDLEDLARLLRRTVLEGRPIRVRHHADGDGMCAAVPVQRALESLFEAVHADPNAGRHLLKRLPAKAPFYEMEDVTRDLNFALEGRARHGQQLPFLLMLDNGSTEEDTPAYRNLAHYDMPIAVVDHHHPDPEAVDPLLDAHVNPYLHDEDYSITTGMMCVELARMIDPEITDDLRHVPAVAGVSDRSRADAMSDYIALAEAEGYDRNDLEDVGEALDYAAHWLRYSSGHSVVNDVLNVGCEDEQRHEELVEFLSSRAARDVAEQLEAVDDNVDHETLESDAHLYKIDLDQWAKRFTYPAPGKTTGELHDTRVQETGDPVITIGYGPDFAVLRSDGVRLDIPRMVEELNEELPGAGVSGGGHLVVGSIKFVKGRREQVIDALVEKMAEAEIDEALSSTAAALDD